MRVYPALTALVFLFSCISGERESGHQLTFGGGAVDSKFTTSTGKEISIKTSHPRGQSLNDIVISTSGFEHNLQDTLVDRDPVQHIFVDDLDQNGFDEVYIISVSSGSGSYGKVSGYASNRDKSMSIIHMPDFDQDSEHFNEYRGHDQFSIESNSLVRIYPIYKTIDSNNAPSGGKRKLTYKLAPGEAMWQLTIAESELVTE